MNLIKNNDSNSLYNRFFRNADTPTTQKIKKRIQKGN